jgi:hypothetical protein
MASQRHSVVWEYGQRCKITPVTRGLSGGTISLYTLAWRNSVGAETLWWLEVTPVTQMAPRAKDHLYGLETRAYFDGLG